MCFQRCSWTVLLLASFFFFFFPNKDQTKWLYSSVVMASPTEDNISWFYIQNYRALYIQKGLTERTSLEVWESIERTLWKSIKYEALTSIWEAEICHLCQRDKQNHYCRIRSHLFSGFPQEFLLDKNDISTFVKTSNYSKQISWKEIFCLSACIHSWGLHSLIMCLS